MTSPACSVLSAALRSRALVRDPEDRPARGPGEVRDKMLDKTIADSFPASDPPSSLPDPDEDSFHDAA
jgi:hypothetical protein